MKPNLFNFATSELSQDAFLCWLLSWADKKHEPQNAALHQIATNFVAHIYHKSSLTMPTSLAVKVKTQYKNIDILCLVNDDTAIVIEDKVGTQQHSDQLNRYKQIIEKDFPSHKIIFVYLQTGDQSNYKAVIKHGYIVIHRADILAVLESEQGIAAQKSSHITEDFALFLRAREDSVNSYQHLTLNQWRNSAWIGFYKQLQHELGFGNWGYVPNQNGGFMCFYWGGCHKTPEYELYLQLEENVLCFKIGVEAGQEKSFSTLRNSWHKNLISEAKKLGLNVEKPLRFGSGYTMTVAVLKDYRILNEAGVIDMAKTCDVLRQAQTLLLGCQV